MFCAACCGRVARLINGVRSHSSRPLRAVGSSSKVADNNNTNSPLRNLLDDASAFGEAVPEDVELQWATQPYAVTAPGQQRPVERVDPADTSVLMFPGEGSESVGMGKQLKEIPAARDLYGLASEIVGWDVWRTCTEGPLQNLSARAAVCVLVTSLAALERARDERPASIERTRVAVGYSVGEIAALVFAGSLSLESAVRLAELRATCLRAAGAARPGGLLTVWPAPDGNLPHAMLRAKEHAATKGIEKPVCQVAVYMYPGCKVVAGDVEALSWLERNGTRFGVRRSARVAGAGAHFSPLMDAARAPLRDALRAVDVNAPRVLVLCGVDGVPYNGAQHVRRGIEKGVCRPLRWEQSLHKVFARPKDHHYPHTLVLGPGLAVRHTLRQVNARAWDHSLHVDV